jgi:hypothetical protein
LGRTRSATCTGPPVWSGGTSAWLRPSTARPATISD